MGRLIGGQASERPGKCTSRRFGAQPCLPSQAAGQPGGQWCWQVGLPLREGLRSFVFVIPKGFLLLSCAKLFGLVRCDGKCLSYRVGPFSTPSFAVFVGSALCCIGVDAVLVFYTCFVGQKVQDIVARRAAFSF